MAQNPYYRYHVWEGSWPGPAQKGSKKWVQKCQKGPFLTVLVPFFDPFFGEGGTARPIKLPKTGQKVDPRVHVLDPKIPLF